MQTEFSRWRRVSCVRDAVQRRLRFAAAGDQVQRSLGPEGQIGQVQRPALQECFGFGPVTAAARALRQSFEAFHGRRDPAALDAAWPHLDSADPTIRHAARIAVEHQPVESWRELALNEHRPTAALAALSALFQSRDPRAVEIRDRLLWFRPAELDLGQTLWQLHLYEQIAPLHGARRQRILARLPEVEAAATAIEVQVSPLGTQTNLKRKLARLLVRLDARTAVETTARLLLGSPSQEDRLQALLLLRNRSHGWTPQRRREYFAALAEMPRFRSGEGMPKFLEHLRQESLATLSPKERVTFTKLLDSAGEESLESLPPPRPVVKKWTINDFADLLADSQGGDSARGATVFREAQCVRCHRVGARGPAVGPDLTHVARRFGRREMLQAILEPSKVVAEHYRSVQVTTKDGRVVVGRVLIEGDYRSETLRIAADPQRPAAVVEIHKRDLEEYRLSDVSPMPAGLVDGFGRQEIFDLLAYLEQGEE